MLVTVLLFGPERAAVGRPRVSVEVPAPATCALVLERLAATFPELGPYLGASRLAVNNEFARPEVAVAQADELALIGLVSGG